MGSSEKKISGQDLKMLKNFGFKDYNNLHKYFNILRYGITDRTKVYDFRWRYIIISKYKNYNSPVKKELIKFHLEYEDYLLKHRSGRKWGLPPKTIKQMEFLFDKLQRPWILSKKYNYKNLYIISDPNKNIWFRAIDNYQMITAADICYIASPRFGTKTKPEPTYKCTLNWNECVNTYKKVRNKGTLWVPEDYDTALIISDNITSTWDSKKGDWEPWQKNRWLIKAHNANRYINQAALRHGHQLYSGSWAEIPRKIYQKAKQPLPKRNVNFHDVANFVHKEALKGIGVASFLIRLAWCVGGSRAGKIIGSYVKAHGLKEYWKNPKNSKHIPGNSRAGKIIHSSR
jgi:hypothetical protein